MAKKQVLTIDPTRLNSIVEAGHLYVHTPAESNAAYLEYVENFFAAPSIQWGCKTLDNHRITPMSPGEITTLVARPGNGKTTTLVYMARREALRCDLDKGECVVYITWEEPVESIEMSIQSGANYTSEQIAFKEIDIKIIKDASITRPTLPIVVMGKSVIRNRGKRTPPMTLHKVRDAIYALYYEFSLRPVLICADYVQKIPSSNPNRTRADEVTEAMYLLSELAFDVACPILLGAQATRDVDSQGLPLPTLDGAQWSSAIEQESFRMIGQLRPTTIINKSTGGSLRTIEIGGTTYSVDKDLTVWILLKQRKFFPAQRIYVFKFNPATFQMHDYIRPGQQNGQPVVIAGRLP